MIELTTVAFPAPTPPQGNAVPGAPPGGFAEALSTFLDNADDATPAAPPPTELPDDRQDTAANGKALPEDTPDDGSDSAIDPVFAWLPAGLPQPAAPAPLPARAQWLASTAIPDQPVAVHAENPAQVESQPGSPIASPARPKGEEPHPATSTPESTLTVGTVPEPGAQTNVVPIASAIPAVRPKGVRAAPEPSEPAAAAPLVASLATQPDQPTVVRSTPRTATLVFGKQGAATPAPESGLTIGTLPEPGAQTNAVPVGDAAPQTLQPKTASPISAPELRQPVTPAPVPTRPAAKPIQPTVARSTPPVTIFVDAGQEQTTPARESGLTPGALPDPGAQTNAVPVAKTLADSYRPVARSSLPAPEPRQPVAAAAAAAVAPVPVDPAAKPEQPPVAQSVLLAAISPRTGQEQVTPARPSPPAIVLVEPAAQADAAPVDAAPATDRAEIVAPDTPRPSPTPGTSSVSVPAAIVARAVPQHDAPVAPVAPAASPAPIAAATPNPVPEAAKSAFAAAIAANAARHPETLREDRTEQRAAPSHIAAAQIDTGARPIVQPTGDTQRAPLDLRQDQGLQHMIDRIEILRDDADSRDTRIRLIPDALGPVDIAVRKQGDAVHVHFASDNQATRILLNDAQPRLAELAEARGVRIDQSSVGAGDGGASHQPAPRPAPAPFFSAPASARAEADTFTDSRLA